MPTAQTHEPRAAALDLIAQCLATARNLSDLLAHPPRGYAALDPADRARAQRLAIETFRQAGRADHHLRKALRKTPPEPILWLMRLAVTEMRAFGAPPHGVISDAVTLARTSAHPQLAGLVNAVLRRCSAPAGWDETPVPRLPGWLRGALLNAYGAKGTSAIEAAHLAAPPVDVTLRGQCPAGLDALALPTGSLRLSNPGQISALPGYAEGAFWVQDAAAALPVQLLGSVEGLRVLDLCAAPGGKTMQLAARGADVTAVDLSASRMARLRENLDRTRLQAELVAADARHWRPEMPFDAIVLDAPCSATGTIRRHPELPWLRGREDVAALRALQAELLDRVLNPAHGLLAPSGRVVFCTCSLLPSEGEDQVAAALARHPVEVVQVQLPGVGDDVPCRFGLRTRPDQWAEFGGWDGFFMTLLRHRGAG